MVSSRWLLDGQPDVIYTPSRYRRVRARVQDAESADRPRQLLILLFRSKRAQPRRDATAHKKSFRAHLWRRCTARQAILIGYMREIGHLSEWPKGRYDGQFPKKTNLIAAFMQAVVLSLNRPASIGRNPELWSVLHRFSDFQSPIGLLQLISRHGNSGVGTPLQSICVSCVHMSSLFYHLPPRVRSPSGGIIVSCQVRVHVSLPPRLVDQVSAPTQDLSRNGITLNGQHIRKAAVILMDGDVLELPNSSCKPLVCFGPVRS